MSRFSLISITVIGMMFTLGPRNFQAAARLRRRFKKKRKRPECSGNSSVVQKWRPQVANAWRQRQRGSENFCRTLYPQGLRAQSETLREKYLRVVPASELHIEPKRKRRGSPCLGTGRCNLINRDMTSALSSFTFRSLQTQASIKGCTLLLGVCAIFKF